MLFCIHSLFIFFCFNSILFWSIEIIVVLVFFHLLCFSRLNWITPFIFQDISSNFIWFCVLFSTRFAISQFSFFIIDFPTSNIFPVASLPQCSFPFSVRVFVYPYFIFLLRLLKYISLLLSVHLFFAFIFASLLCCTYISTHGLFAFSVQLCFNLHFRLGLHFVNILFNL